MKKFFGLLLFGFSFVLSACSSLPTSGPSGLGAKDCGVIPNTKYNARYCHWAVPKSCAKSSGTLQYVHGLGENENSPDSAGGMFTPAHSEFKQMAADKCLDLVTVSWSRPSEKNALLGMDEGWMIRPPGTAAQVPPSPTWAEASAALDYVGTKLNLPRPMILYGQSMGGFNAATIAMLKPGYADKLLLTHPVMGAFPNFDPCTPPPGAMLPLCNTYTILVGQNFWVPEWVTANPVAAIKKVAKMPPIYVQACPDDEFGLFKGPKAFADNAKAKGFDVTFEASPKGCKHTDSPSAQAMKFASP